ncbi:DUF58 domain-containing protein [Paenibacillus sp. CAU 1782]
MNGGRLDPGSSQGDADYKLLFPEKELLSGLERLSIAAGGRIRGTLAGKRRSFTMGGSQEFADYRPYAPGDDVRRIDWNVYGRTGKAFMRQYWDEQELHLHLYMDVSRSMLGATRAGEGKLLYAMRLAACVGYVALCGDDRLIVRQFDEQGVKRELGPLRGRVSAAKLFRYLADAVREGEKEAEATQREDLQTGQNQGQASAFPYLDMSVPFRQPGALPRRSGVSWLFTDALYESGIQETLLSLVAAGQSVVLVQVLNPEELNPVLSGELRLIDSELGTGKEVAVSPRILKRYREEAAAYQQELKAICGEKGAVFVSLDTSIPIKTALQRLAAVPGAIKT